MSHYGKIILTDVKDETDKALENTDTTLNELYRATQINQCYANTIIKLEYHQHPKIPELKNMYQILVRQSNIWHKNVKEAIGPCISALKSLYSQYVIVHTELTEGLTEDIEKVKLTKDDLVEGLAGVAGEVTTTKKNINKCKKELRDYNESLNQNKQPLTDIITKINNLKANNVKQTKDLDTQINEKEQTIKELQKKLIVPGVFTGLGILAMIIGPILILTGVGAIAGTAVMAGGIIATGISADKIKKTNETLAKERRERNQLLKTLAETNEDSAVLNKLATTFSSLIQEADNATIACHAMFDKFDQIEKLVGNLGTNANNLAANLKQDDPKLFNLRIKLKKMHKSFESLEKTAENYEKNFILNVIYPDKIDQMSAEGKIALPSPSFSNTFLPGNFAYELALANRVNDL